MRRKTALKFGLGTVALLIIARLAVPSLVTWHVNRTLARIPGYEAAVDGVDLDLYRGAYRINGIRIHKLGGRIPLPFVEIRTAFLSVHGRALLQGRFVGRVAIDGGSLNFVNGRSAEEQQLSVQKEWLEVIKDLVPLRINHFTINNVTVRYRDPYSSPIVDVRVTEVRLEGQNFSNTRRPSEGREATIFALGLVEGSAPILVTCQLAPSAKRPTFELNMMLEKLPLLKLNDLFKVYGGFDVEKGSASFYMWMNVQEGALRGTLKPLLHNVEVFTSQEERESLLSRLWESLVGAAAGVFENQQEAQIATIIPLGGNVDRIEEATWIAVVEVVRNAFFQALKPGLTEGEKGRR
jgi:hypothetical protein